MIAVIRTSTQLALLGAALFTSVTALPAAAQQPAMSCTYDDNMASARCDIDAEPVTVHSIVINGGKCPVWNHRLIKAKIDPELREKGKLSGSGEYSDADVKALSAVVAESIVGQQIPAYDFFRFESYRCAIKTITIETSVGQIDLRAH